MTRRPFKRAGSKLYLATLLASAFALQPIVLFAAQSNSTDTSDQVSEQEDTEVITIVAHRQPRNISQVAGTVTIMDQDYIERNIALNIDDLVRYEPGIEVDDSSTRFGYGGFRIRGIGGNRTVTVVDNVPIADNYSVGNFANSGRGLFELGLVSRVEVLRGPASTLYGSKALGGVVAMNLLDASDILQGDSQGNWLKAGYNTDSDRYNLALATAFEQDDFSLLIAGAKQYGHEADVANLPAGTTADEQNRSQYAGLIRAALETDYGRFRLSLDGLEDERQTDINAVLGTGRLANTTSMIGDDSRDQTRVLLDHHFTELGFIDQGTWRLWHQQSDTEQDTFEERLLAPTPVSLVREFNYDHKTLGLGTDLETRIVSGDLTQRLGYGFEFSDTELTELRNASQTNLDTDETTNIVLGEVFPLRDFPKSTVQELGIYIHDEIELWSNGLVISPGLRYEHYELKAENDPLFDSQFPDANKTNLTSDAWLPKLGLLMPIGYDMEWFSQYARGHRAPPFADVNIGLDIPMFNIRAISNPDLKSERGYTFETGLRYRGSDTQAEFALFHNRYSDFIQSRAFIGFDAGTMIFQSINRDKVIIEGSEFRLKHYFSDTISTDVKLEYIRGEDKNTGEPIADVRPPMAIVELSYMPTSMSWETRLVATASKSQKALYDASDNQLFSAPGYTSFDWITRWFPADDLQLSLGIFNLTDKTYWRNSNVANYPVNDPTLPLLAEPGRSVAASLVWSF